MKNDKEHAEIVNNGIFRIRGLGVIIGMPDTILGRVEFTADREYFNQAVPNSTYNELFITGKTKRNVDSVWNEPLFLPLRTLDSFIVYNTILIIDSVDIHAKDEVANNGARIKGSKEVRMNREISSQTLEGNGKFNYLNIDNPYSVDVVNGGGFTIEKRLELTRGVLRNNAANNFKLADTILIVRHVGASLADDPEFEGKNVSVHYVGDGSLTTGPELPDDTTALQELMVMNTEGVTLGKSVTVNRNLYLASPVNTEPDTLNKHTLTFTNDTDPVFDSPDAEIDGSFRRTNLRFDDTRILFNNPYTFARFANPADANGVKELTFRIKPRTFPPFSGGENKVQRLYVISALDAAYDSVVSGINMTVGYGWRVSSNITKDENNSLPIPDLILQRWTGSTWFDITNSLTPNVDSTLEWAFSSARTVRFGDFAVGMPGGYQLVFRSTLWLEGPFRFGSMAEDLRVKDLIPLQPPDIYPYNLDPRRIFISVSEIPDSVVDWIVLEFRPTFTSTERYYRTVFIRIDGKIVDLDGVSPVILSRGSIDSGEYFIAVRHRNHLAIITENRIGIYPETVGRIIDFSSPSILMGRNSALKPIGFDSKGSLLFGMIGGDVNGDGVIDEGDLVGVWNDRDYQDRYMNSDIRMNGIVTTRDFNVSWNNRNRVSNLP